MTVRQLSRDQLAELKERMVCDEIYQSEGRTPSYGELADAGDIPDERVFERYDGVRFVPDDFLCTAGEQQKVQVRDARHRDGRVDLHGEKRKEAEP